MTDLKVFNLTLIRHGQTVANVQRRIQGHSDTPMTKLGIEQAKLLGKSYKSLVGCNRIDKVYTSDLGRALTTCNLVIASMDIPENAIKKDCRLRERKYGKHEGRSIDEFLVESYAHGYNESNFTQYTPEGAESMDQVMVRVRDFFRSLCNECREGDEILVVSHWATIKEFLKVFQPLSGGAINKDNLVESPNTAFSKFKIRCSSSILPGIEGDFIAQVQVICLHQTAHLIDDKTSVNMKHPLD